MASVKKLYISSAFRISGTTSRFEVELPETVETLPNACLWVTDVTIPVSWLTIDATRNLLYIGEANAPFPTTIVDRILTIAQGTYTADELAAELTTELNSASKASVVGTYTASYAAAQNRLQISVSSGAFYIWPDGILKSPFGRSIWNGPKYDPANLFTANKVFGIPDADSLPVAAIYSATYTGAAVDVRALDSIYLCSETFTFSAIGPNGSRSIIRRIPVNSPNGSVISEPGTGLFEDFVPCGGLALRRLNFSLRDEYGNVVDLAGLNWSFSLVFGLTR